MKTLIVYDSAYGNTAKVAQAVEQGINKEVMTLLVGEADEGNLQEVKLLIIGSPTQGGRPTKPIQDFLKRLPRLDGTKVAAFDTRFAKNEHGFGLKILMNTIGFAAEKIANALKVKGGVEVVDPAGFIVDDTEGPLADDEIERAKNWGSHIADKVLDMEIAQNGKS